MNPLLPADVQRRLVLASRSPRRRDLLAGLGFDFDVTASDYHERNNPDDEPADTVRCHAAGKARDIARRRPGDLIIGADTAVVLSDAVAGADPSAATRESMADDDGAVATSSSMAGAGSAGWAARILGKPADAEEARAMLRRLSGREHMVLTGLALVKADEKAGFRERLGLSRTSVRFRVLGAEEISAYVASGEPFDKAGAYGIQGLAAQFVTGIKGCYFNVMGLPLELLTRMLRDWAEPGSSAGGER